MLIYRRRTTNFRLKSGESWGPSKMPSADKLSKLALPALRASMGDWVYYICFMRMEDASARISIAKEIHSSKSLQDLLQRQLTNRSLEISTYLLSQSQRFFNALVVGTYGGDPQWTELAIKDTSLREEMAFSYLDGSLGILTLSGTEKLFAIDGQHRVAGIRQALKSNLSLRNEEVCVIFVPGVSQEHRDDDPAGFERTRRLFTTLNRYAKPVSKKDIIALDEDDVVAIVTRRLVEEYPLFRDKVSLKETKSIHVSDKTNLTTIVTLYDALDIYLPTGARGWKKFKRFRPPEDQISVCYEKSIGLWETMVANFPALRELRDSDPAEKVAAKYRHNRGGHLLFRPIGLLMCVKTIKILIDSGTTLTDAAQRVSSLPMEIAKSPWAGLMWDVINLRVITASENQKAALKLLFHAAGGDLSIMKTNAEKLRKELAGLLNVAEEDVEFPKYS